MEIIFMIIRKKITCQGKCIFQEKNQKFESQMHVDANTLLLIIDLITH